MKLAEALAARSDLQTKIAEMERRLNRCVQVQVGDNPPEDPEELLSGIRQSFAELQRLISAIDKTNAATFIEGKSIASWLSEKSTVKLRQELLLRILERASVSQMRHSKSEIRFVSTIKAAKLQKEADDLAMAYRSIDLLIQASNWKTELLECTTEHEESVGSMQETVISEDATHSEETPSETAVSKEASKATSDPNGEIGI